MNADLLVHVQFEWLTECCHVHVNLFFVIQASQKHQIMTLNIGILCTAELTQNVCGNYRNSPNISTPQCLCLHQIFSRYDHKSEETFNKFDIGNARKKYHLNICSQRWLLPCHGMLTVKTLLDTVFFHVWSLHWTCSIQ